MCMGRNVQDSKRMDGNVHATGPTVVLNTSLPQMHIP